MYIVLWKQYEIHLRIGRGQFLNSSLPTLIYEIGTCFKRLFPIKHLIWKEGLYEIIEWRCTRYWWNIAKLFEWRTCNSNERVYTALTKSWNLMQISGFCFLEHFFMIYISMIGMRMTSPIGFMGIIMQTGRWKMQLLILI